MLPTNPLLNATAPAGPHLPVATLRQYAAGMLAGAARHRVEAHTLACPRCADILEGLLQTPPATTDQALAQLQQRLRLRVQQADAARPALPRLRHRWLAPQLAAAATLLLGLLAGGWYIWQQRQATPAAEVAAARPAASTAPAELPAVASAPSADMSPPAAPALSRPATPAAPVRNGRQPAGPALAYHSAASEPLGQSATGRALPPPAVPAPPDSTVVVAQAIPVAATPAAGRTAAPDSAAPILSEAALARVKRSPPIDAGRTRLSLMPAAPAVPPTPAVGYPAWREKIRREATEFKPDEEEKPLSGTVQLRLLIGPNGKIQQLKVLHGLRADYDEEAQRLVCDGPAWIPGIGGGKRAAQSVDVSVPF